MTNICLPGEDAEPPDPFDPANLRLSQDFGESFGVKKILTVVPVRKPDRTWFSRIHPHADFRIQTAVIEKKEEREIYLVARSLWPILATESTLKAMILFTSITRQGVLFLWPVTLPGPDGKHNPWHASALAATAAAETSWVRVQADMSLGAYQVMAARGDLPEPVWPELLPRDILEIAFKGRVIDTVDHPVLRGLRGEI